MNNITISQTVVDKLIDDYNTQNYERMLLAQLDPNKGFLFMGNAGVGKTTAVKQLNITSCSFLGADDLFNSYLNYYRQNVGPNTHPLGYKNEYHLTIDDLGVLDSQINSMGTIIPYLQLFIHDRHKLFLEKKLLTNFTTNLLYTDLSENLGARLFSRLHEMCNFITIEGVDYRSL
jgi:DNA replication protein DnaC